MVCEAQSQTETSLLDFGSLSFGEVPKRLKGARSANGAKRQTASNRTMREEFYQNRDITKHCAELKDWNEELEKFIYKYNHYRPHQSLENED